MRASVLLRHGGPEELVVREIERPEPDSSESLIRVGAVSVEPGLDASTRRNGSGWQVRFPHVLGASMAGTVEASNGPGSLDAGTRVAVSPHVSCGLCRFCRRGRDNSCTSRQFMGVDRHGGYADFCAVPTRSLIPIPEALSFTDAVSASVSYGVAWNMLVAKVKVQPADVVFVSGARGSVGVASAQIAALFGARVLLGSRSPKDLAGLAQQVGALGVVDTSVDFADAVRDLAPEGVDVVVDTVGAATWATNVSVLAPEGRITCCGASSGGEVNVVLRDLYRKNATVHFAASSSYEDLQTVYRLISEGRLRPAIAQVYSLEEAPLAHARIETGEPGGKLVISLERDR